ncbi:PREDICTED: uncharacterized protein LOC104591451 isoform X2 [Nelumbo nucifera]|uniref:Kinetochore protein SPC25 n=2 Tax=Nelumbo nucifera TaxID=4432 RepID=A0A1U7ZJT5_NELNU|nr:PREDICTED: uncharacterized protein LOC104591451 isoform X2 [Nelumbo nucifera]DAD30853.1 TPA_asm: hypothetical protein HUJ06_009704 [Nelumbo nucifera]
MERRVEDSILRKMEEVRLVCDWEISIQQKRMDSAMISFRNTSQSIKLRAKETAENQVKLGKLKTELRELEDDLVKALAVKTRKEAKRMAILDSISATKARLEELRKTVHNQKARKDEYASIISQQSVATLKEKDDQETKNRGDIEEAISWYNRVLGFRIEGGRGVKFIFSKINLNDPTEEYSFTIRHADDTYTLLDCDPYLDGTKELIQELNQTNGLLKFVRIMREKFQAAAVQGVLPLSTSVHPESSTISVSAPALSISSDSKSDSLGNASQSELKVLHGESNRPSKKINHRSRNE